MTIRQEMHSAAKKAKILLGDSGKLVVQFVQSLISDDGGFMGRDGKSDLYYTVFGIESLRALGEKIPTDTLQEFLPYYKYGEELDLVHLACLVRCRANLSQKTFPLDQQVQFQEQFEKFRCPAGGYANDPDAKYGSAYGCFLALGAYQDLQLEIPDKNKIIGCIKSLAVKDGGFANDSFAVSGSTPATAAAVSVLRQLGEPVDKSVNDWLLTRCYQQGGFVVGPSIPFPDILSTATALHALAVTRTDFVNIREECLDFLDSLWNGKGGFCGNWADSVPDCEYTYYGLLALGHLAGEE